MDTSVAAGFRRCFGNSFPKQTAAHVKDHGFGIEMPKHQHLGPGLQIPNHHCATNPGPSGFSHNFASSGSSDLEKAARSPSTCREKPSSPVNSILRVRPL